MKTKKHDKQRRILGRALAQEISDEQLKHATGGTTSRSCTCPCGQDDDDCDQI